MGKLLITVVCATIEWFALIVLALTGSTIAIYTIAVSGTIGVIAWYLYLREQYFTAPVSETHE
jgi:hypothetical protein